MDKRYEYERDHRITVGRLLEELKLYKPSTEITFGSCTNANPLIFYRVKGRGEKLVQIELNEVDEDFIKG